MIVILVVTMMGIIFDYTGKISVATETASIQQTKNIINSSLAVVFATYAVKGELGQLNELDHGNPFNHLAKHNLLPVSYQGELRVENLADLEPGWYYDRLGMRVVYKTFHDERVLYFSQVLDYRDVNNSGRYEPEIDVYQMLNFR